jgi:hypothetical protein
MLLESLGAKVVGHMSERLTHFVCSNIKPERVVAAKLLALKVVSPLWIEQCLVLNRRARESDFEVSSALYDKVTYYISHPEAALQGLGGGPSLFLPLANQTNDDILHGMPEPKQNLIARERSIDSPFFSSSQRNFTTPGELVRDLEREMNEEGKVHEVSFKPTVIYNPSLSISSSVAAAAQTLPIPKPLFREYIAPKVSKKALQRRRSERLIDMEDDEDDDDEVEGELATREQLLSLETKTELPVLFVNEPAEAALCRFRDSLMKDTESDQERKVARTELSKGSRRPIERERDQSVDSSTVGRAKTQYPLSSREKYLETLGAPNMENVNAPASFNEKIPIEHLPKRRGRPPKAKSVASLTEGVEEAVVQPAEEVLGRKAIECQHTAEETELKVQKLPFAVVNDDQRVAGLNICLEQKCRGELAPISTEADGTQMIPSDGVHETSPSLPRRKMVVAITGFDRTSGDHESLRQTLLSFIDVVSHIERDDTVESCEWHDPYESNVVILDDESDLAPCTHLIVKNGQDKLVFIFCCLGLMFTSNRLFVCMLRRTMRILFACARGSLVLKEDFVFDSLCVGYWVDPRPHLVPRYAASSLAQKLPPLQGKQFVLLSSSLEAPDTTTLSALVVAAGGDMRVDGLDTEAFQRPQYFLVGQRDDLFKWIKERKRKKETRFVRKVLQYLDDGSQVITAKVNFLFRFLRLPFH